MEDNWIKVEPRNNKKEIYAKKIYKGKSSQSEKKKTGRKR